MAAHLTVFYHKTHSRQNNHEDVLCERFIPVTHKDNSYLYASRNFTCRLVGISTRQRLFEGGISRLCTLRHFKETVLLFQSYVVTCYTVRTGVFRSIVLYLTCNISCRFNDIHPFVTSSKNKVQGFYNVIQIVSTSMHYTGYKIILTE